MNTQALLASAIRNNSLAWFESYGKIWPKDRSLGLITPKSNYLQRKIQDVINHCEDNGVPVRIIGLKPRQKGSTTFFSAADYCHLRRKAAHACVIGGQLSQTKEVAEMLKTYQSNDRFQWGNTGEITTTEGRWSHGSRLKFETAGDRLAGIAGTYQVLHGTEVARWAKYGVANAAEVLANILKCVPLVADSMIILESTAEGASGDYYNRWLGAIDADDFLSGRKQPTPGQYIRVFAPWFEFADSAMRLNDEQKEYLQMSLDSEEEFHGERDLLEIYGRTDENGVRRLGTVVEDYDAWEQLAWRRWSIREECKRDRNIFDRDYPKNWNTAFQTSGNLRFNQSGMANIRKRMVTFTPMQGIIEADRGKVAFRQTERGEAKVTIFEKPTKGCRYILAVDPMTGETQVGGIDPDRHGVFVMRAGYWDPNGRWKKTMTAARLVPNRWDIDVLAENVWRLARYYGHTSGCKIVVEMNQDKGITELLKLKSADLYQREIFNQREQRMSKALGYQTNEKTREVLVERLAQVIREWDRPGDGIDIACPHAMEQLENFIRKANGRSEHAEGWHDDDVFAIGLGVELIDHATVYSPPTSGFGLPPDMREHKPAGLGSAFS